MKVIDPTGIVIEIWRLRGCFVRSVEYGDMRVDGDVEVSFTITYNTAILAQ